MQRQSAEQCGGRIQKGDKRAEQGCASRAVIPKLYAMGAKESLGQLIASAWLT
jgi:hypothetical protein